MRNYDLSPLLRQWIGFDKLASSMGGQEPQGFPPYNIEKSDDNHYRISLALAGFRQSELNIEVEGPRLTVSGKPTPPEKQVEYLHQGLVCKEFQLTFTLAEHLQVSEANLKTACCTSIWCVRCRKPCSRSASPSVRRRSWKPNNRLKNGHHHSGRSRRISPLRYVAHATVPVCPMS